MKKFVALTSLAVMGVGSPTVQADGAAVYNSGCMACHNSGVAGSPKIGVKSPSNTHFTTCMFTSKASICFRALSFPHRNNIQK